MSTEQIIAGFVISTIGFSLALFGRKQRRPPQLVAGVLLMGAPFVVTDPGWLWTTAAVIVIGLTVGLRFEQ